MANDALLQAGLTAARAGDLETAAVLFARLVKQDPSSEEGWLGLGFCFTDQKRREYCFQRVLTINPENSHARQALGLLEKPANKTEPAIVSPVIPATKLSESYSGSNKTVSPFLSHDEELPGNDEPDFLQSLQQKPVIPKTEPGTLNKEQGEKLPSILEQEPVESSSLKNDTQTKKKNNPWLVLLWSSILILFVLCLIGTAYLLITGKLETLIPLKMVPTWTMASIPTQTTGSTPTLQPTFTPSSTPIPPTATLVPTNTPEPETTIVYTPEFANTTCWFNLPPGFTVTCGYVTLPEDRTGSNRNMVQLAVAVFHSTEAKPASDPVIFLQGGPGGEAVKLSADNFDFLVRPFLSKRDFIAFDQRGTGLSKPALGCDELENVYKQDIQGQIPASSRDYIYTNAFRSCHGSMSVGGIDLNSFTTLASSDDIKDIVSVLGYQKVNLYGASYGTRLALVTMREHPEIVRSALLDSVVPVEAKLFDEDPLRYGYSLQSLFDTCAVDPACNSAFPNLQTIFWDLVDQLDANPVEVTVPLVVGSNTEEVDGANLIGVILSMLKSGNLIAYAPETIYSIKNGDYSTFAAAQAGLPNEFQGIDLGLYISMICHEQIFATTPKDLQAAMDSAHDVGRYFRLPFFGDAHSLFNTCKVWGSVPPAPGENDIVVSDIPALIIEGKYDPSTPPIFGKQVAANLENAFYMEFPNQGHTPTAVDSSGCAYKTMLAFFDNPQKKPDMTCLENISGVDFVVP